MQSLQCYIYGDLAFYDLISLLNNHTDYNITTPTSLYNYNFNFCKYATDPCGNGNEAYAFRKKKIGSMFSSSCVALSDNQYSPDVVHSFGGANVTSELVYTLGGGDTCNKK